MNIFDRINDWIQSVEFSLVNLVSTVAPWLAPLAPAYLSYYHMRDYLLFPNWVALSIAGVVEMLGLSTISTSLMFWNHNRRYSADKNKVPISVPVFSFLFYLGIVMTVNVMLEVSQTGTAVVLAKALLTLLTVPAAVTLAVRSMHREIREGLKKPARSIDVQSGVQFERLSVRGSEKGWKRHSTKDLLDRLYVDENLVPSVRELQTRMAEQGIPISIGTAQTSIEEWKSERGIK